MQNLLRLRDSKQLKQELQQKYLGGESNRKLVSLSANLPTKNISHELWLNVTWKVLDSQLTGLQLIWIYSPANLTHNFKRMYYLGFSIKQINSQMMKISQFKILLKLQKRVFTHNSKSILQSSKKQREPNSQPKRIDKKIFEKRLRGSKQGELQEKNVRRT